MKLPRIRNSLQLEAIVEELGILPFYKSDIPGFSVEECVSNGCCYIEGIEGPWEWREQLARKGTIAYGKLFNNRSGFVSMAWYPDLCNYRRDGYDYDARYEDGLLTNKGKKILDLLEKRGPQCSSDIKYSIGFSSGKEKGYESAITTLQMQTYIVVNDFTYKHDKTGRKYGWGVAHYSLSEHQFGEIVKSCYSRTPTESYARLMARVFDICPHSTEKQRRKLIG